MSRARKIRLTTVRHALRGAEARSKALARQLKAAPPWYRPNLELSELTPTERGVASRLHSVHATRDVVESTRHQLAYELDVLERETVDPADWEDEALDWINGATESEQLLASFRTDPTVPATSGLARALTLDEARRILRGRASRPDGYQTVAGVVRTARLDPLMVQHLRYSGFWRRHLKHWVRVLLPLMIQTRFRKAGSSLWNLDLLVTPDHAFFCNHDPLPTETEVLAVDRFWQSCRGDLRSPSGRNAFRWLASSVGGGRAAWLCRELPPVETDPGVWRVRPPKNVRKKDDGAFRTEVRGLPTDLEVWMARAGGPPLRVASMTVDHAKLGVGGNERREWLLSFKAAKRVGLAATISLGTKADDIDVIYVVGTSDESPATLFERHRDAGDLAVLEAGTPTNSLPGHSTADLASDADHWWKLASGRGHPSSDLVSLALSGSRRDLGAIPGEGAPHQRIQRALVTALWPALFGYSARTLWGMDGVDVDQARQWAIENLLPEGPVPAIRIGTQPYGVLPVTGWRSWTPAKSDPPIESKLLPSWKSLWAFAAKHGESAGHVAGSTDPASLLRRLMRTATSTHYGSRQAYPLSIIAATSSIHGTPLTPSTAKAGLAAAPGNILKLDAAREIATLPAARTLTVPLIRSMPSILLAMAKRNASYLASPDQPPAEANSLLHQLLGFSLLVVEAAIALEATRQELALEPLFAKEAAPALLENAAKNYTHRPAVSTPWRDFDQRQRDALKMLASVPTEALERPLRAVLDTAMHRIDPFLIGLAWRRLRDDFASGAHARLGAYGWVDNPRPGDPGPTDGGLIVAPSHAQLATAVVARDAAVRDSFRWSLALDSNKVSLARDLAEQVRSGLHLTEALGYRIEAALTDWQDVKGLRAVYPGARGHVCNGLAVVENRSSLPWTAARGVADRLQEALFAYTDITLLDGVHKLVQGRAEAASVATEAASGLGPPPPLDVVDTPRSGDTVATNVYILSEVVSVAATTPVTIAEPSLSSLLSHLTGAGVTWDFGASSLELSDLGLDVVDLAVISPDELARVLLAGSDEQIKPSSSGIGLHRAVLRWVRALASDAAPAKKYDVVDGSKTRSTFSKRLHELIAAAKSDIAVWSGITSTPDRATHARIASWGIRSSPSHAAPTDAVASAAATELKERVAGAEALASNAPFDELASAIRLLATGESQLPLLSIANITNARAMFHRVAKTAVVDEWLVQIAAVRPRLAAIESAIAGEVLGEPPSGLAGYVAAADPWTLPVDRKVEVAFGRPGVLASSAQTVAIGILDGWTDSVPAVERVGHAAFGFRAPPARPPQAVLVAAPPKPGASMSMQDLVEMLEDIRQATRARAVEPERVAAAADHLPAAVVPQRYFSIR